MDAAIREEPLDDISVQRLKESDYVFSGIKTFHELNEAFPSLLDEDGNRKPFERFLNDVQKVHKAYNVNYLRTEYNFAHASALMAARWKRFEQDGDRYLLQYRTIGDDRVRRTHRMLHGITLPITSKFWDYYTPPLSWNCRCTVAQVRRGKYPVSDEREAMNLGSQATAGKYQEMFMFNPGKRMATFPAYNAYTIRKCNSCQWRPDKMKLAADIPDNELCKACRIVQEMTRRKDITPPASDTYREVVKGKVYTSPYHGANEVEENERLARFITERLKNVRIWLLPRLDSDNKFDSELRKTLLPDGVIERKNPDYYINDLLFDAKSMMGVNVTDDPDKQKRLIENRIKKAKEQADNIVLEIPEWISRDTIGQTVVNYLNRSKSKRIILVCWKNIVMKFVN